MINKNFKIIVADKHSKYINQCLKIAKQNHESNGGTLKFVDIVAYCKYIVCATKNNEVLGYVALVDSVSEDKTLYIAQLAVKNSKKRKGIGSALMKYIINHSKDYQTIKSNVQPNNIASKNLHIKLGFEQDYNNSFVFQTEDIKNNKCLQYTEKDLEM